MTIEEIKADIVESCRKFVAAGFKLQTGDYCFLSEEPEALLDNMEEDPPEVKPCGGCALTAVLFAHKGEKALLVRNSDTISRRAVELAGSLWGWGDSEVQSFTDGFDDVGAAAARIPELHELGKAVAAEVLQ